MDSANMVLTGKLVALNAYIRKTEISNQQWKFPLLKIRKSMEITS